MSYLFARANGELITNIASLAVGEIVVEKSYLLYQFPVDKQKIARLSYDQKMEWYAYQFQKNPGVYPVHLVGTEFERFWKWRVLMPMKFKRFLFRVKNGEIFKRYPHITEIKKKVKPHSI